MPQLVEDSAGGGAGAAGAEPPLAPPPPPPPPPSRPAGVAGLLKAALEEAAETAAESGGLRELLRRRKARWAEPAGLGRSAGSSQEPSQCGLVALWMAGALLSLPKPVSLEKIVQVAVERGYTAQGEMFSAEVLSGGLEGQNHERILQHLGTSCPVLIPYDEDSNHEPCLRRGYKAHWAVASGVLLGVEEEGFPVATCQEDEEIPGLFHARPTLFALPPDAVAETFLISKQGKSGRYQLWNYTQLQESNAQLTDFSPKRAADGKVYIVPAGGVREGLCGKAVLLRPGVPEASQPH
uniref:Actin maturation protease n=1 Tax=Salvator merianae TaxID=96440 RepID=A0A8D0BA34_SALMN